MIIPVLISLTVLLSGIALQPEEPSSSFAGVENGLGMVWGEDHFYAIQAPKGWVLDNSVWAEVDVFAVFYEVGSNTQESPMVGFSRVHPKHPDGIVALVTEDLENSKQGASTAVVEQLPDFATKDGMVARVYSVKGVPNVAPEWVAYIDAPTVVILVGVAVREPTPFEEGRQLLEELVGSIEWVNFKIVPQR